MPALLHSFRFLTGTEGRSSLDDREVGLLGSCGIRREVTVPSLVARKKEVLSQAIKLPSDQRRSFIQSQFPSDETSSRELETLLAGIDRASRSNPGWTSETTFGDDRGHGRSTVIPFPEAPAFLTLDRK